MRGRLTLSLASKEPPTPKLGTTASTGGKGIKFKAVRSEHSTIPMTCGPMWLAL